MNEITSAPCQDNLPHPKGSVCFSDARDESHHSPHPIDNGVVDALRNEYHLNEVSDESGSSWQILEHTGSHGSRHDNASQSPRSALADFPYAESAVGISKKVSLQNMFVSDPQRLTNQDSGTSEFPPIRTRHICHPGWRSTGTAQSASQYSLPRSCPGFDWL